MICPTLNGSRCVWCVHPPCTSCCVDMSRTPCTHACIHGYVLCRPASVPQLESMVAVPPPAASVTASVTSPSDSMLLIVVVCLGFYMLSATISAAIGALMHLSGAAAVQCSQAPLCQATVPSCGMHAGTFHFLCGIACVRACVDCRASACWLCTLTSLCVLHNACCSRPACGPPGRSLQYATRGAANWTSAGILDTFDIMRLPLAYEIEEPNKGKGGKKQGSSSVVYVPWDGPDASYIPVNMVKVLRPGFLEAGLVVRRPLIQPEGDLSIISVTSPGLDAAAQRLPNNGHGGNGSSSSNGNGRANGSTDGTNKS